MVGLSKLLRRTPSTEAIVIDGPEGPIEVGVRLHPTALRLVLRICRRTGRPLMTLPHGVSRRAAERFANSRRDWIATRLAEAACRVVPADRAVIPVRGVDHTIHHRPDLKGAVRPAKTDQVLDVPGDANGIERRVRSWLKRQAKADLEAAVARHTVTLGVRASRVSIRDTTSRWGSCSHGRVLSFSWRLVMAPPFVLDYVAAHEVAHLKEMNHGRDFWAVVERLDPDMETARRWLRDNGSGLHRIVPGGG